MKQNKKRLAPKTILDASSDLNLQAGLSKLVREPNSESSQEIDFAKLSEISQHTYSRVDVNKDIKDLFPDIELSEAILVSSILAPNDMTTTSIVFGFQSLNLPSELKTDILKIIKDHVNINYSLEEKFQNILAESIFTKGAFIEAIIPENVLDSVINDENATLSTEAIVQNIIDRNNTNTFGLGIESSTIGINVEPTIELELTSEEVDKLLNIEITENVDILAAQNIKKESFKNYNDNKVFSHASGISNESMLRIDDVFKKLDNTVKHVVSIPEEEEMVRSGVGMPLIIKLPVESVIPMHVPGDVTDHVGYIVLVDKDGSPLSYDMSSINSDIEASNKNGQGGLTKAISSFKDNIIKKANASIRGTMKEAPKFKDIEKYYSKILESTIINKLNRSNANGISKVEIDNSEIFRVMLYRKLKNQKTRILFLSESSVSFYAFKYRSNGTGKSLLESVSVLVSIRAMLLYTKLAATIRNSINNTDIVVTLDEKDPDPHKTMNKTMSTIFKTFQSELPVGITKINDLSEWSQKIGMRINFKHPNLPDMSIDRSDSTTSKNDNDVNDSLSMEIRKNIIMSFGIPPKAVEDGYDSDFATTIVQNDRIFTRNVNSYRKKFTEQATSNIRKLLRVDMSIFNIIQDLVKKNINSIKKMFKVNGALYKQFKSISEDELVIWITRKIINDLTITLPTIEQYETDNMKSAFDAYKDSLDEIIDIFLGDSTISDDFVNDLGIDKDSLKTAIMNTYIRRWMSDNNYMPELTEMYTRDNSGKSASSVYNDYSDYLDVFVETIEPFLKTNKKLKNKVEKMIEKIQSGEEEPVEGEKPVGGQEEPVEGEKPVGDQEEPTGL